MSLPPPPTAFPPPPPVPALSLTPSIPRSTIVELIILVTFEFIALLCILCRIYIRVRKNGSFYLNDYAIFWAFFWTAALTSVCLANLFLGTQGFHIEEIIELVPKRFTISNKLYMVAEILWAPANAGVKVSIIDLYIKIFGSNRKFLIWAYITMGFAIVYCVVGILNILLICLPLDLNWNPFLEGGHCGNRHANVLATGIMNLILDICVIALPMPLLSRLRMPLKRKLGIAFMFSIGFLICGITIWRIIVLQNIDFHDPALEIYALAITSCLEPLLGIVNACLPIFRSATGLMVAPFMSIKTALLYGWIFGRNTTKSVSNSTADSSLFPEHVPSDTQNLRRLYNHLDPLSIGGGSQLTTYKADPIELQSRFGDHSDGDDTIQLTSAWDVESGTGEISRLALDR